jgi:hypothetical protein
MNRGSLAVHCDVATSIPRIQPDRRGSAQRPGCPPPIGLDVEVESSWTRRACYSALPGWTAMADPAGRALAERCRALEIAGGAGSERHHAGSR